MVCSGTSISYNEIYGALSVDTSFHPAFSTAATKRISEQLVKKLTHLKCTTIESIRRHISHAIRCAIHTWMITVNDSDGIPIFVIRNLAHGSDITSRKVYTISILKQAENEFMEYISYTFNVLLTSLLLLQVLQFISQLSHCTFRQ
jgi:hypothetical protein